MGGTITEDQEGMINPIMLDYSILKRIVSTCHEKLSKGEWSLATLEAFLSKNAIDARYSAIVLNHACNIKQLSDSYDSRENDPGLWIHVCVNKRDISAHRDMNTKGRDKDGGRHLHGCNFFHRVL